MGAEAGLCLKPARGAGTGTSPAMAPTCQPRLGAQHVPRLPRGHRGGGPGSGGHGALAKQLLIKGREGDGGVPHRSRVLLLQKGDQNFS